METNAPTFVGIDVSEVHLGTAIRPGSKPDRDLNDPAGIAAVVARLVPLAPPLVAAPQVVRFPVAAINPPLARIAEAVRPEARDLPSAEARALDAPLSRRQQLLAMRLMESNRPGSPPDPTVRAGLERHVPWLEAEADRLLAEAIKARPTWREKDELLRSIPS